MPWTPPTRETQNIQFASLRATLDALFAAAHDELSTAYYDFWRSGQSHPWRGFDVQPTPAASKQLFDTLHALIGWHYDRAFHQANQAQPPPRRIPEAAYNTLTAADGTETTKSAVAEAKIAELRAQGIELTI